MIYVPRHFEETDLPALQQLMHREPFATLITQMDDDVQVSHLPLLLDTTRGNHGTLHGHMARANPHWQSLRQGNHLAIFHGPHRYISPAWYGVQPSVPTWNYAVAHARGPCTVIEDKQWLLQFTRTLTERFEFENSTGWRLPEDSVYLDKMVASIVGFELHISTLTGKFKLSQNRTPEDRCRVVAALEQIDHPCDGELIELMRARVDRAM